MAAAANRGRAKMLTSAQERSARSPNHTAGGTINDATKAAPAMVKVLRFRSTTAATKRDAGRQSTTVAATRTKATVSGIRMDEINRIASPTPKVIPVALKKP